MPLQRATDGETVMTQFEMHACEALGLLKFDFLGLINLTILADAVELIRRHRGVEIDVDRLPLDDTKTFELLSTGETTGIFQLEGSGMRRYVKDLRPTELRDLAAMVALFRPGPMANIPAYIRRKHGDEKVTYLHPSLEPALRDTYGIFVYQEDIMAAAIAMADYTGPEADNLCYAIRKKNASVLREHEAKFKAGAKKKGIPPAVVDQVFAAFEPFARYGFNKAHATCYGLIAYQTAYLKANYPVEFMTAVFNGFRERSEKVAAVVAECRRLGIEVRPPDVQRSASLFEVEIDPDGTRAIRFGLAAVKNVGESAVDSLVAARSAEDGGPFLSLDDLCRRVDPQRINKRVVESLIKVNALVSLGSMATLLDRLDSAMDTAARHHRDVAAGQSTMFDLFAVPMATEGGTTDGGLDGSGTDAGRGEISRRERLRWEKELLGLYLTEHPLGDIADQLPDYVTAYTGDLAEESDQSRVTLGGIIQSTRRVITRAGSTMLVVQLEDLQGSLEVVVFPKVFTDTVNAWTEDSVVLVSGRVDHRDEEAKLLCETVTAWDDAQRMGPGAFATERDRMLRARGPRNGSPSASIANQPLRTNGSGTPPAEPVARPRGAEPAPADTEEAAVPRGAVPIPAVAEGAAGSLWISFGPDLPAETLLDAIESVTAIVKQRPGALPVVLAVPVAGATRQVRLPQATAWDEELEAVLRREIPVELTVERRPGAGVGAVSSAP